MTIASLAPRALPSQSLGLPRFALVSLSMVCLAFRRRISRRLKQVTPFANSAVVASKPLGSEEYLLRWSSQDLLICGGCLACSGSLASNALHDCELTSATGAHLGLNALTSCSSTSSLLVLKAAALGVRGTRCSVGLAMCHGHASLSHTLTSCASSGLRA